MQLVLILLVIAGGMGLSVEAGLLGPLGGKVGDLWATFSILPMTLSPSAACATAICSACRRRRNPPTHKLCAAINGFLTREQIGRAHV